MRRSIAPSSSGATGWSTTRRCRNRRLDCGRRRSVPVVGARSESFPLLAHHAEAMATRCFHHPPRLDLPDLPGAERNQPLGFGFDIIGLDVQVHARGVRDLLQQDDRFVGFGAKFGVLAVVVGSVSTMRLPNAFDQTSRCGARSSTLAIDDEVGQPAAVRHQCGRARSSRIALRKRAASPPVAAR